MVRFKLRYLLGEVLGNGLQPGESGLNNNSDGGTRSSVELKASLLAKVIRDAVQLNFGDEGTSLLRQGFEVKYVNARTGLFIVRVARDHFRTVWGALTFVSQLASAPCTLTVIHCGGTLRSCQKAAIEHSRVELKRLHNSQTATADLAQELADLAQLIEQETAEIDDDGDDD